MLAIVNEPFSPGEPGYLRQLDAEAKMYADLGMRVERNVTAAKCAQLVARIQPRVLCFAGHGDIVLGGNYTLAFVTEGGRGLEAITPQSLAEILGTHALYLFLANGCNTRALAEAAIPQTTITEHNFLANFMF